MKNAIVAILAFLATSPAFAGTLVECAGTGLAATPIELTADSGLTPVAILQDKLVSVALASDNTLSILVKSTDKAGAVALDSVKADISTPVMYQKDGFFFVCAKK